VTSEVLIMNEECVAIAADSAATVGLKTYKADKIFNLSDTQPIGIMIYGSARISGVPAGIIIKEYRSQLKKTFSTISECVSDFLNFVENGGSNSYKSNPIITSDRIDENIYDCCLDMLEDLKGAVEREYYKKLAEIDFDDDSDLSEKLDEIDREKIMGKVVERILNYLDEKLNKRDVKNFMKRLFENEGVCKAINGFAVYPSKDKTEIFRLLAMFLISKEITLIRRDTGIVIMGYGTDDLFPSFEEVVINGLFYKGLNYREEPGVKISSGERSYIEAFAQDDVVRTYLYGIDDGFYENMPGDILAIMDTLTDTIFTTIGGDEKAKEIIKRRNKEQVDKYISKIEDFSVENYLEPTKKALCHLSKDEMASMAESLIHFTSLKRHVSKDPESVGGPIDVAIISRSEGFIWIKRKYYFDITLNPHYLERRRGT